MNKKTQVKKDLAKLGIPVHGNYVKKSDIKKALAYVPGEGGTIDVQCYYDDILKDAHKTYAPDTYYVDYSKLPACIKEEFEKVEPTIDDSSYTVHVPTAFLRVVVKTLDGAELNMESNLGEINLEENEDEDRDEDEEMANIAGEMKATFDWRLQDVYFEVTEGPQQDMDDEDEESDIILTR